MVVAQVLKNHLSFLKQFSYEYKIGINYPINMIPKTYT